MEDDGQDERPSASAYFRHRSPTFSKEEVKALLNIVEKFKTSILNKSTTAAANHAKEAAWTKIAKIYNRQGFSYVRSADCLKIKWDNLKKEARKSSKNLSNNIMDLEFNDGDEVINQIVAMMCAVENNTVVIDEPVDSDIDLNETDEHKEVSNENRWNGNDEKEFEDSLDADDNRRLVNRSMNFSPKECNLLLQCVRREKNIVLSKASSTNANRIKNRAWSRITNSYNKLSPQKRSTKVLRTKFTNMKRLAKNVNFRDYLKDFGKKHEKLEDATHSSEKIKSEPSFDGYRSNQDDDVNNIEDLNETSHDSNNHVNSTLDPLCTVLNSDFSLGSINQVENKEIVKLKKELLNYKLETAKLQRKRIEDIIQADALERESKALETSLRLRTARLETIAAEMKLPPNHPSLSYTVEEARAQLYIHHYGT